jgi:hypothetical protein
MSTSGSIIVTRSRRVECVEYVLSFIWRDSPGAGFSFDCDQEGNVDRSLLSPEAIENLDACIDGRYDVRAEGVIKREWSYREPAVGKCSCGGMVFLDHFTNTCKCGRDYDSSGWLLAPRSQWGEDTGEHLADILRIP